MRHDFGATQAAAPPLAIDPLITAMLQKAANQVPWPKARATSPAFEVRHVVIHGCHQQDCRHALNAVSVFVRQVCPAALCVLTLRSKECSEDMRHKHWTKQHQLWRPEHRLVQYGVVTCELTGSTALHTIAAPITCERYKLIVALLQY